MYALLNGKEKLAVQESRLFDLEREHYHLSLRLAELDALEVGDTPQRAALEQSCSVAAACMRWHHQVLGVEPVPELPRVDGDVDKLTGDDEGSTPEGSGKA